MHTVQQFAKRLAIASAGHVVAAWRCGAVECASLVRDVRRQHLQGVHRRDRAHRAERGALRDALRAAERRRATRSCATRKASSSFGWCRWRAQRRRSRHGITRESFPQGTVMSMGVHPRRDGKPAGDRGESGLFQCPKGKAPAPGKHCDSVEGATAFGEGEIPPEGSESAIASLLHTLNKAR